MSPAGRGDDDLDVDTAFADIVARWDAEADVVGRWPAQEDRPDAAPPARDDAEQLDLARAERERAERERAERERAERERAERERAERERAARDEELEREERDQHDRYVPPEPPPLPRLGGSGDLLSRASWTAVVVAPVLLLLTALVWRDAPRLLVVVAVVAFVAGFASLVLRMPDRRDDDDGWDDGAVV